jgi:chromosome segregation ATPase
MSRDREPFVDTVALDAAHRETEELRRQLRSLQSQIDRGGDTAAILAREQDHSRDLQHQLDKDKSHLRRLEGGLETKSLEVSDALARNVEIEDDYQDKLRSIERRSAADTRSTDALRADLNSMRRRAEESETEVEVARRRVIEARQLARDEARSEVEAKLAEVRSQEEQQQEGLKELRTLRETQAGLSSRLADALQQVAVANAEADAARAASLGATSEGQTTHQALVQATQRLTSLDGELARSRAELLVARQENDSLSAELRKVEAKQNSHGDRALSAEQEMRRLKSKHQAEQSSLSSRVAELSAGISVLQEQLDKADEHETKAVREIQQILDRASFDGSRLKSRVSELETRSESDVARVLSLER